MTTTARAAVPAADSEPLIQGLLQLLTNPARPGRPDGGDPRPGRGLLPDLPGAVLLSLVSDHHRNRAA
jgi:hypothetical protein